MSLLSDFWEWLMPPKTPKHWPPVARLSLVSQAGQTIVISTVGTIAGKTGQGRNRTNSQLASWTLYWGDGQQEGGEGPPPTTFSHTYDNSITTAYVRLVVVDVNTLTATATLTVSLPGTTLAPPTAVTAVLQLANQVLLSWDYPTGGAAQFQILRAVGTNPFALLATVDGTVRQYTDTNLTAATTYTYAVAAVTSSQTSALSVTAAVTTSTAPNAPTLLAAVVISSSEIDLSWTDNASNEDGYQIERDSGAGFVLVATVGADVTAFNDTSLTPATNYSYRVRAYNVLGASAYTNTATGTTLGTVPNAPSNLSANAISATAINLQWTNNGPATTIRIERRIGVGAFSTLTSVSSSQTTFSDTGLTPSTTYGYRLFAVNGIGDSAASNIAEATTLAAVTIPNAPSALNAVAISASRIDLTWTDNSTDESGFTIERALGAGGAFAQVASVGAGVVAYSDTGLAQSQLYRYRVKAYNSAGASSPSNTASATTLLAVPNAPTSLSAVATSPTSVHLAWTAPVVDSTHGAAANILVQRRISPAAFATIDTISASNTAYDDATVSASTAYDYRLIATNASGNSAASNTASVTTPAALPTPPAAPSALSAVAASATRVNLSWTDNSANESGFVIQRSVSAGPFADLATVNANVVTYADLSVVASTSYQYRVYAYNGGGNSANSNTASVTTPAPAPPTAPSNLVAITQSGSSIALTWQDNSTDETGFSLERQLTGGVFTVIQTLAAGVTSYLDTSLTPGTTYSYRIRAFSANGNSAYSNTATATTTAPPPTGPTANCSVSPTSISVGQSVTLSTLGTVAGTTPIASYSINWGDGTQTGSGAPPLSIPHTYNTAGSYIPRLTVTDQNALTSSASAATVTVAPVVTPVPPNAPTNLTGSQTAPTQVTLGWQDNANNEDGFNVERRLTGAASFGALANTGANIPTYQDNTVTQGNSYDYRVRAFNVVGNSAYTNIVTVGLPNGADYYVAWNPGNPNGGAGTLSNPYGSWNKVISVLAGLPNGGAGKRVWGRGGTYDEYFDRPQMNGTSSAYIVLQNYPNETVWIKPTTDPTKFVLMATGQNGGQSYVEFDGINMDAEFSNNGTIKGEAISFQNGEAHHLRFKNLTLLGSLITYNPNTMSFLPNIVSLQADMPAIGMWEFTNVIARRNRPSTQPNDGNINPAARPPGQGFYIAMSNTKLNGFEITDMFGAGLQVYNHSSVAVTGVEISNGYIHDITQYNPADPFRRISCFTVYAWASGAKIWNNRIVNCGNSSASASAFDYSGGAGSCQFWNNLAYNVVGGGGYGYRLGADGGTGPGGVIRNNIAYLCGTNRALIDTTGMTIDHNFWDGADPRFANAAAGNFRLASGSPCIDQGTPAPFFTTDADGVLRPQLSAWDIGPYEYH